MISVRASTCYAVAMIAVALPERPATPHVPLRQIVRMSAVSREPFASVTNVRELRSGRVLVNDGVGHRLILFDSALATFTTVADTMTGTQKAYGDRPAGLLAFAGDTTLFVDPVSMSFIVINPDGTLGRVIAAPRPNEIVFLLSPADGAGFDGIRRLVYHRLAVRPTPIASRTGGLPTLGPTPDSLAILRLDMVTRRFDTVASLKAPSQSYVMMKCDNGSQCMSTIRKPFSGGDDWAVLPDGSIALIRASDYHIDWINPDGSRSSSPKIEHTWTRLTDSDKAALVDSMKLADSVAAEAAKRLASYTPPLQAHPPYADPADLSDYRPPFYPQTTRADVDGNLWIGTTFPSSAAGEIYDVVNRAGALIDRVQLPGGCTLVGFGRGVVYLASRNGDGYHVARAPIH